MNAVFLSLGSNLGNRHKNLDEAIAYINSQIGEVIKQSPVYETEPWGEESQPAFYNMVLKINTGFSPDEVMNKINQIEVSMGRLRTENNRWKERPIDIDILFYNDLVFTSDTLTIPHPMLHLRNFTLVPLLAIAPELIHPVFHTNIRALSAQSADRLRVTELITS